MGREQQANEMNKRGRYSEMPARNVNYVGTTTVLFFLSVVVPTSTSIRGNTQQKAARIFF